MAFKVPIHIAGKMSAFYFGTAGNKMFLSMMFWKKIRKGKKPGTLTPIFQPINKRYQFEVKSFALPTNQYSINLRKTCDLIFKNFQRIHKDVSARDAAIENLFEATKIYIDNFEATPINTYISPDVKNDIINNINSNNRHLDISFTQFLKQKTKDIFTMNGDLWDIMNDSELTQPTLYHLRTINKYLAINYLPLKKIKYTSTRPLITNNILSRMGDEMLNRSCDKQ